MAGRDVFLCDAVRTPIGRYGGTLAKVRADDLAAVPIRALMARITAAPIRPARTIATLRAWRCCSRAFQPACRA